MPESYIFSTSEKDLKALLRMSEKNIKKCDIGLSLTAILCISTMLILFPHETTLAAARAKESVLSVLSPFFLWIGFGIFLYSVFLAFSRYGAIRLGEEKPDYSFFHWFFMIFCTGMGSNLLYWSGLEWMYYYQAPPLGAEPFSQAAAELAVLYGGFHWGCIGWSIYAIGAVTLGLRFFRWNEPQLSLSAGCARAIPMLGEGGWARLIEICFLLGTLGGCVTMISFVIPMYADNLSLLFGIRSGFTLQILLMAGVTVIFTLSSWTGLKKGIKRLSTLNIALAMLILFIVLVAGPTLFILKSMTNAFGYGGQHFIQISLWTDFVGNSGFPETWTAFYWAWWIGLAPSMWIFTARISRGRTIRELILGVMMGGSLGCWLYFGIISNFGLLQQLTGQKNLVSILNTQGPTAAISELVLALPGGESMLALWTVTGIVFLITTLDSSSYTLALSTTRNGNESENAGRILRLFWSMVILVLPLGLMYADAPMGALQSSAVLTAVPIAFLTIIVIYSGHLYIRDVANGKDPTSIAAKRAYRDGNT